MQTLKKGSSGKDVEQLQSLLMERGYEIEADGIFGKATEDAGNRRKAASQPTASWDSAHGNC